MINKRQSIPVFFAVVLLFFCGTRRAASQVIFEWVTVGNPGNAEDPSHSFEIPGIGSVADVYRIAKYEVTNAQYAEFLNAVAATDASGLYSTMMGTDPRSGITRSGVSGSFVYSVKADMGNKPVNRVSFFDAMRFVNWLHNGQPVGAQDASTTEDGVYAISDGLSETRSVDAQFFIPTQSEWYKAAYHQPFALGGDSDDYWDFPTASNDVPTIATANITGDISNPGVNVANHTNGADWNGKDGNVTTVGSAGPLSESFYGTSDQAGNLWEWIETLRSPFTTTHVQRGGSWDNGAFGMQSRFRADGPPEAEGFLIGFRIASPAPIGSADINGDGNVDLSDFALFQLQFDGP